MKKTTNHPGRIRPIIAIAARMIQKDPTLLDDIDAMNPDNKLWRLRHELRVAIPALKDPAHCPNCDASMSEYVQTLDIHDVGLVQSIAYLVRMREDKMGFTEANKVRVSSENIHHTQKCRTTKCSKLGLIAKAGNAEWSVTTRGWEAMRGMPVPKVRVTFRGQIIDRPEDVTTFAQIIGEYRSSQALKARKGKVLKHDHRRQFDDYDPSEWVEIAGNHQGNLL